MASGFKKVIYYKVAVSIYVNGVTKEISFDIRHYHEKLRYVIEASLHFGGLKVEVFDKDLKFKKDYYEMDVTKYVVIN